MGHSDRRGHIVGYRNEHGNYFPGWEIKFDESVVPPLSETHCLPDYLDADLGEKRCMLWFSLIIVQCQSKGLNGEYFETRGGKFHTSSGYLWLDPNVSS